MSKNLNLDNNKFEVIGSNFTNYFTCVNQLFTHHTYYKIKGENN